MGHLRLLDLAMMIAYAVLMLFIGWWYSRKQETSEDYFVASRNSSPWLVGVSMIATMLSTVSYIATPGEMIAFGPGMFWSSLHGPFSFVIVGYLIIPHIMRRRVTSGYELLESQFGNAIRRTASLLFILARLVWMGLVIYTCSKVIADITRLPLPYVLAAVGAVTTAYTVMGGIRAVIVTDALQFLVLMLGGILVVAYVTYRFGGFSWWPDWKSKAVADLHWQHVPLFSFSPFERVTVFTALLSSILWWVCNAASDQMMIQRYLCTRDARAARRSFLYCLIGDIAIVVVLWIIGFALLGYYLRFSADAPDPSMAISQQADELFPHFIATVLPTGLRGLIVAALFAAAMSSLSSGISSVGTVLIIDFGNIFARGTGGEPHALARRAKHLGLVIGLASILFSFVIGYVPGENIYTIAFRISGFFVAPLFALYVLAFFVPFSTPAGAWVAIIAGFFSGILFSYWEQIVGSVTPTSSLSVLLIMPFSLVISLGAGILISLVTTGRDAERASELLEQPPA